MNTARVLPVQIVRLKHHAIPVEVLSAHHGVLDYLALLTGLVGALAGIVAVIFAIRSAKDASRSARAAEESLAAASESLAIMRAEAKAAKDERDRRADPDITLTPGAVIRPSTVAPPGQVIMRLAFTNAGNRAADRMVINFVVPDSLSLTACNEQGIPMKVGTIMWSSETLGDHKGVNYWAYTTGPIDPSINILQYLLFDSPLPGRYMLKAVLTHGDLPDGQRTYYWLLNIPSSGPDVTVELSEPADDE